MPPARRGRGQAGRGVGADDRLQAAAAGDPSAWAALYDELAPAVLAFLRARGAPDPDDLLGEVMSQVARDLQRFRGDATRLRGWVLRIARNRLVDDARYRARRPVAAAPEELLIATGGEGDVEDEALARLADERLLELIGSLRPSQRDVLILRFFSDLTIAETARALGKRPGAVKALQRRALKTLRDRM